MLAKPNYYVFHIKCIYDNTKSFIFIQLSFEIQQLIWCLRIFFKDLCPWLYIETDTYSSTGPGITYFCQLWFYYCIHRSSPRWYPYSTFYKKSSKNLRYCRLWDECLSKLSLFVDWPFLRFSIGYIKSYKLMWSETARFSILFLYFVLKLGELSVH